MSEIIGKELAVGISVETTKGTAKATAEKWLKNVESGIKARVEKIVRDSSMGILEDSDGARIIKKWVEGDLDGVVHADAIGYLFYALYGAVTTTTVAGSVKNHAFSLLQGGGSHPSLSLYVKDGSVQQKVLAGCMLGSMELNASVDDFLRFKASFIGMTEASNTDTVERDTEYDFIGKDIEIKMASTEAGLSSATALKAKDLKLSWDKGLNVDHVLGSYTPNAITPVKMAIEGEMTLNFVDTTFKDLYSAETYNYFKITITGDQTIGTASHPTITIILNAVQIMEWDRTSKSDEVVTEPIKFKAFYNATDSEQSTVAVQNLTAEYNVPLSA